MGRSKDKKLICERCEKEFDELVTREGFCQSYFVEWICEDCFEVLEGVSFSQYNEEQHYGVKSEV